MDGQCTKWRRNIAENFNRLSTVSGVHERYRVQTNDRQADRQTGDSSERELTFTFTAKMDMKTL